MDSKIKKALLEGKQVTNGIHYVSWYAGSGRGYMCCYEPGCCDGDFSTFEEIDDFLAGDEWEIVPKL